MFIYFPGRSTLKTSPPPLNSSTHKLTWFIMLIDFLFWLRLRPSSETGPCSRCHASWFSCRPIGAHRLCHKSVRFTVSTGTDADRQPGSEMVTDTRLITDLLYPIVYVELESMNNRPNPIERKQQWWRDRTVFFYIIFLVCIVISLYAVQSNWKLKPVSWDPWKWK